MLDEPYRWIEAVENRREYIEDRLKVGSPVVGLAYDEGIVLLTVTTGEPKVFEVYDRMALSAVGHPADIEKLRIQLIDMAHMEGFGKSEADVTLHRLVNFGLIPVLKQAFDTVYNSPFITKLLAVELGRARRPNQFYSIHYDGELQIRQHLGVVTGSDDVDAEVVRFLEQQSEEPLDLRHAARVVILAWALARTLTESEETEEKPDQDALWEIVREKRKTRHLDVAVLTNSVPGSSKFRRLSTEEVEAFLDEE